MISVYEFTDYREFLKRFYGEKKKENPRFSYRLLTRKAGFKGHTFFSKVLSGSKNLSHGAVFPLARALGLDKNESQYFMAMVGFSDSKTKDEREFYFNLMQSFGRHHSAVALRTRQMEYFCEWYHAAIRELASLIPFHDDFEALGEMLDPPISAEEARKSVELLVDLDLLRRGAGGAYTRTSTTITTGENFGSFLVKKFQETTAELATCSLRRHPRQIRDFSTLTLSVSGEGFRRIRDEIGAFRAHLLRIASRGRKADRVYQINLQLYPLSTTPSKKVRSINVVSDETPRPEDT